MRGLVLLAAVLALVACRDPKSAGTSSGAAGAADPGRALAMWEVSKPGMPTSHLLGTCFLGFPLDQILPTDRRGLIAAADTVVVELAEDDAEAAQARMALPNEGTVSGMLGDADWAAFQGNSGMGPFSRIFDGFHPALMSTMTLALALDGMPGLDMELDMADQVRALAEQSARPVRTLETLDSSMSALESIPMEQWLAVLRRVGAEGTEPQADETKDALSLCLQGDKARAMGVLDRGNPWYDAGLLARRAQRWTTSLEPVLGAGATFVAADALVLAGPEGVLERLKQGGWTVRGLRGVTVEPATPSEETTLETPPSGEMVSVAAIRDEMKLSGPEDLCPFVVPCLGVAAESCAAEIGTAIDAAFAEAQLPAEIAESQVEEALGAIQLNLLFGLALTYGEPRTDDPACAAAMAEAQE